jgi:protein-disulfide isomerase
MKRLLALATLWSLLALPVQAGETSTHWKLSYLNGATGNETTGWLLKVDTKDGKSTATLAAPNGQGVKLTSFELQGDKVRVVLSLGVDVTFTGQRSAKDDKKFLGTIGDGNVLFPSTLELTDATTLDPKNSTRNLGVEPLNKITQLTTAVAKLNFAANQAKDPAEKEKLLKELADARKTLAEETPKLYREVFTKYGDSVLAGLVALQLLQTTKAGMADDADIKQWCDIASKTAPPYGARWEAEVNVRLATALLAMKGQSALALEYAVKAEKALDNTSKTDEQIKVLQVLQQALADAGKADESKQVGLRVDKLETILDKEYLTTVPPFKPAMFAGRKSDSKRVVVLELFTGAQCPPCVAADVAFDALQKTYKSSDLVLIQYHLHIPQPDPLTNNDTVARAQSYSVNSTPTVFFNGKPVPKGDPAGGGGFMPGAETKYEAYRAKIDPLLEQPTNVQVQATAKRAGNIIQIAGEVNGVEKPGPNVKVRVLLVEESVRYVGTNKLRFHHQVVRAMPNGPDGQAIDKEMMKFTAKVDLDALRKDLTTFLDLQAGKFPFPRPGRPMEMQHLRVIVLVQDDITREILQAAQVEVLESKFDRLGAACRTGRRRPLVPVLRGSL